MLVELNPNYFVLFGMRNSCIVEGVLERSLRKAFLMVYGSFTVVST
jgi:hypothetical protein